MILLSSIKIIFIFLLFYCASLLAQNNKDTTTVPGVNQNDSLKTLIDSLGMRLDALEKQLNKKSSLDSLLTGFEDAKDTSLIPENQRSRRKQLDALLELISQRPGQLFFNGQVNNSFIFKHPISLSEC